MKANAEKLVAARTLIAKPDGWAKYGYAFFLDGDGDMVETDWDDPRAFCFCALGALQVSEETKTAEVVLLEEIINLESGDAFSLAKWNDQAGRTQAEVVAAFDRAIELARSA